MYLFTLAALLSLIADPLRSERVLELLEMVHGKRREIHVTELLAGNLRG